MSTDRPDDIIETAPTEENGEIVHTPATSLDALRNKLLTSQQQGIERPESNSNKVWVTREGKIVMGNDPAAPRRELSEVSQGVFAARRQPIRPDSATTASSRLQRDRHIAAKQLPRNTVERTVGDTAGFQYSFRDDFGERYTMFVYFDGSLYQALLLEPELEGKIGGHDGHLFRDGNVCLGPEWGVRSLEEAYSRSVIWANGITAYLHTGTFPFSINNQASRT